jgi:beta-glucosidase
MSGELGFYNTVVGNMGDRNDLNLWWDGSSLIEAVAAVNPNTIVVIHSVGPV